MVIPHPTPTPPPAPAEKSRYIYIGSVYEMDGQTKLIEMERGGVYEIDRPTKCQKKWKCH